jgi:hypothetical protein
VNNFVHDIIFFSFSVPYLIRSISAESSDLESVTPVPPWGGMEVESAEIRASVMYIALLYALLRREGSDEGDLRGR